MNALSLEGAPCLGATEMGQSKGNLAALKSKRALLAKLEIRIQELTKLHEATAIEIEEEETAIQNLLATPVASGEDPTLWLPAELMLMILLQVPSSAGVASRVCKRWAALMGDPVVGRRRWRQYASAAVLPRQLRAHSATVNALAIGSRDLMYSASKEESIKVWCRTRGKVVHTLDGHHSWVYTVHVAQDGTVFSGSADHTLRAWSGSDGKPLGTLTGHDDNVRIVTTGADGTLYSGSDDKTIRVWDATSCQHMRTLEGHTGGVLALAVTSTGTLFSAGADSTIRKWSANGDHIMTLEGHDDSVHTLAVDPSGRTLYSGSADGTVRLWSIEDGGHIGTLTVGEDNCVTALAFDRNSKLFVGSSDGMVRVWHEGVLEFTLQGAADGGTASISALAFANDGTLYSGAAAAIQAW